MYPKSARQIFFNFLFFDIPYGTSCIYTACADFVGACGGPVKTSQRRRTLIPLIAHVGEMRGVCDGIGGFVVMPQFKTGT